MTEHLLEVGSGYGVSIDRLGGASSTGDWDMPDRAEAKVHRIHAYPAKFPAFLATKALAYARREGVRVRRVGDVFCGCGTVAYEATEAGLEFWGCDINPVATLIARVKGSRYRPERLRSYSNSILAAIAQCHSSRDLPEDAIARLRYWFTPAQFDALGTLLNAIESVVPKKSNYRSAFLCAFSAILKSTSQWRQRSTKPTLDPHKRATDVTLAFAKQCEAMAQAWAEPTPARSSSSPSPEIHLGNVMTISPPAKLLDVIVSSPPYVTSYEYADLHQLSALWLGYAADYRSLRTGSVGTSQHRLNFRREFGRLNNVGLQTVFSLYNHDKPAAKAVANYYLDMQTVAKRCHEFLAKNGVAVFVIGNTEYSGVRIDNAAHLAEALFDAGFKRVRATKRRISNKMHTPYRNTEGRFSRSVDTKHIYCEEFILIGHR